MRKFYTGGGCVDGVAKQIVETGYGPAKLYYGVTIKADPDNDAEIYVGVAGVTSSTGFCLDKGDEIELPIDDIHSVYIIADPAHSTVQVITVNDLAAGGKFDLTFGGQTTDPIAVDAAAATVEAALEALSTIGAGNVTVAGDAGGPYTATFGGDLAKTDVETITGQAVSETQTITVTSGADPDVMVLTFDGESTAELPHDASAAEVQAALEALASVGEGNALVTSDEDAVWVVEFTGDLEDQDVGAITGVCGIDEVQTITLSGNVTTDTVVLTYSGQTTGAIASTADAATVQAALEDLSNLEVGDVTVSGVAGAWVVSFGGLLVRTDVDLITGTCTTNEVQTITLSGAIAGDTMYLTYDGETTSELAYDITSANLATALKALDNIGDGDVTVEDGDPSGWVITFTGDLAATDVPLITGVAGTDEVQSLTLSDTETTDEMYISFDGETTEAIAYDASTATVEAALEVILGEGNVTVGGVAGAWTLTFTGELARQGVDEITAVCGTNETQTVRLTDEAAGDHIVLTLGAESTDELAYNAEPATVQAALEAFTGIGEGGVSVVAGDPDGYDLEFVGPNARTAMTDLTGVGGKYQVQAIRLTNEAAGDHVILTFDGEDTEPFAYDATAATVQSALEALTNIAEGDVAVMAGDPDGYDITFKGTYAYTDAPAITGVGGSHEKQVVTLSDAVAGDVFTLSFDGQTTAQLAYDADAATVQSALEDLSNIDPGDVVVEAGDPGWEIEFQGAYAYTGVAELTGTTPQDEIQNVTVSGATGGTFTISFGGQTTAAIAFDAEPEVVEARLEALSSIGEGNVSVEAGTTGYDCTFINDLALQNLALMTADDGSLTGETPSIAVTELVAGTALTVVVTTTVVANELTVVVTEPVASNEITIVVTQTVAANDATVAIETTTPGNTASVVVEETTKGNEGVVAVEETVAGHAASVDVVETTKGDGDATVSVVSTLSSDGCYYSWIAL